VPSAEKASRPERRFETSNFVGDPNAVGAAVQAARHPSNNVDAIARAFFSFAEVVAM
jgi:hypothetical protein